MLSVRKASAVLCSTDLARSQEFYEQKVGLTLSPETIPNHLLFDGGDGSSLLVYGRPSENKGDHTQVRFWSNDVEADVASLLARGVVFEDYDFPGLKTVDHVCVLGSEKAAWFKDTEGNYLCLHEDIA